MIYLKAGDLYRIRGNAFKIGDRREINQGVWKSSEVDATTLHGHIVEIPVDQEVDMTDLSVVIDDAYLPTFQGRLDIYFYRLEPL